MASRITRHLAPWWKSEFGLTVTSWRVMAVIGRYEPLSAMQVAERTSTDAFAEAGGAVAVTYNGVIWALQAKLETDRKSVV